MHRRRAILWEWADKAGNGALSSYRLQVAQQARLDESLDRIEELQDLTHDRIKGVIHPFDGPLKKLKIRGNVAVRPILVLGPEGVPEQEKNEVIFLAVAIEKNYILTPFGVKKLARVRLEEIRTDPRRRQRYERS
jgi:hypothetical protein